MYFFILPYDHIIILPSPSKSSTLGRKSIKSEALHVVTNTNLFTSHALLRLMTISSLLDKEEKEVANLCHSFVDLHGNFYYPTTLLFQRKNVGWASKKMSITPAEGQVVFHHHCRQHSCNFCSCSSSLDLRSLSFDLIYSNFKSSFLNFLSSLDSIFKLQVKLWELRLKLLVKEALHFNFRYSWLECHWTISQGCSNTQDPFELHIIFLKSQNKKGAIFLYISIQTTKSCTTKYSGSVLASIVMNFSAWIGVSTREEMKQNAWSNDFTAITFKVVSAMQKISTYKISTMWGKDLNLFVQGHAKHGEDNVKFSSFLNLIKGFFSKVCIDLWSRQ